jgi:hypothetical protein
MPNSFSSFMCFRNLLVITQVFGNSGVVTLVPLSDPKELISTPLHQHQFIAVVHRIFVLLVIHVPLRKFIQIFLGLKNLSPKQASYRQESRCSEMLPRVSKMTIELLARRLTNFRTIVYEVHQTRSEANTSSEIFDLVQEN